jgi:TetR/AcrR family transcriptional regulator, repressor for uid operon
MSPRVTKEHKEGLKQRIIQAAVEHFSKEGYDGTKVDDIADALKISKGTIYFYFGDKSGLFRAISDHFVEKVKGELTTVFRTAEEMDMSVGQFYENIRKVEHGTDKLMVEMVAESTRNPKLRKALLEHRRRVLEVTIEHLKILVAQGMLKKDTNVAAVAAGEMALYVGLTISKLLGVSEEENKATWIEMASLLRSALINSQSREEKKGE